jgi:hypothetical protein
LSNTKKAGKLRQKTKLEPVIIRNVTRWSSSFSMLERFFDLKEYFDQSDNELIRHIPSGPDMVRLGNLREDLKIFEKVTKRLQFADITMLDVRLIFDEMLTIYPSMEQQLKMDAPIVKYPCFESGICKVLNEEEVSLTVEERDSLRPFLLDVIERPDTSGDLLERALKRKKKTVTIYEDMAFIPPTSNVVERAFSAAR